LLHDISKRKEPNHFEGKDHVHPFFSAAAMLRVFKHLGFIKSDMVDKVVDLLYDSVQPVQNVKGWEWINPEDNYIC
jgi:hypothetical protein